MTSAASSEPRFVQPYRYRPIGNFRDAALGQLRLDTPSMQSDLSSGTLYKPCLSDGSRCATPSQIGKKPRFHCFFRDYCPTNRKPNKPATMSRSRRTSRSFKSSRREAREQAGSIRQPAPPSRLCAPRSGLNSNRGVSISGNRTTRRCWGSRASRRIVGIARGSTAGSARSATFEGGLPLARGQRHRN
jgi:hypothetical protein